MRVAVSNIAWEPEQDREVAEILLKVGVGAIEVAPTKIWPDLRQASLAAARDYGRQWADRGLPVVSAQSLLFGRPDLHVFDDSRNELIRYLEMVTELCVAMGATALVFGSPGNRRRGDLPPDAAHRIAVDVFGRAAARAAAAGASLCMEANPEQYGADYLTCASDAAALVRAVDNPGLRLHLDTACMALAGDDGPACVAEFAPLLRHVHVSEPFLGPVGSPDPGHDAVADALRAVAYEHHVSVEMRPVAGETVTAVERAARYAVDVYGDPPVTISTQVPQCRRQDFTARNSRYAIVVPVINEGDRIRAQLRTMADVGHGMDVLVADGGSNDGSLEADFLAGVGVRTLLTKTGPGRLSAQLRMGFAAALDDGYEGVVTVDGNGKDGVEALPRFVEALDAGYDFVQGSRFAPGGRAVNTPPARYWGVKLMHAPITSIGARRRFTDTTNGFRAHSARLLSDERVAVFRDVFDAYELLAYLPVRAARLGYRTCEVPVVRAYPAGAVPTKIHSTSAHLDLLRVVVRAASGYYDPAH